MILIWRYKTGKMETADLDALLAQAELLVATQRKQFGPDSIPGVRALTSEEISALLKEVRAPVCIFPAIRDLLYRAHCARIEAGLRKVKVLPAAIPRIGLFIRIESGRGYIQPGTNAGGIAANNVSSGTYQGTLNTRHTPGARQKASAGIKGQREILQLNRRSQPTVTLAFSERQTFYSIMMNIRPQVVEVTVADLMVKGSSRPVTVEETNQPEWYQYFAVRGAGVAMEFVVRLEALYLNRITLSDLAEALTEAGWLVLYSALDDPQVLVHVYPTAAGIYEPSLGTAEETTPTDEYSELVSAGGQAQPLRQRSQLGELHLTFEAVGAVRVKGLPGIKDLVPIPVPVLSVIGSETAGTLKLDATRSKRTGIDAQIVGKLCTEAGLPTEVVSPLELKVTVPVFRTLKSYLDRRSLAPDEISLVGHITEGANFTFRTDLLPPGFAALKRILEKNKVKIAVTANPGEYQATLPKVTAVSEITAAIDADKTNQSEYENQQRNLRFGGESQVRILRPPTPIEDAATIYLAESVGGTFATFIDADLIYGIPIDINRTVSNDAREILEYFGIEGARSFLEIEIYEQYAETGFPLEAQTIALITNAMTYRGVLVPFTHSGVASADIGPMAKSAVQRPQSYFADAALNGRRDPLKAAAGCVMTGKLHESGTGLSQVRSVTRLAAPPPAPPVELRQAFEERRFVRDVDDVSGTL